MIDQLINLVKAAAQNFLPSSLEAVATAEAIIDLAKTVRPTLSSTDQAALDAALPDLLDKMNRSVDQAVADLRGA
jgi:hypothetical protein